MTALILININLLMAMLVGPSVAILTWAYIDWRRAKRRKKKNQS